jgi:dTMP kinase
MPKGRFITLEGGEGAGKSTQARLLAEHLRQMGLDVVETREPGGAPLAERIRQLVLSSDVKSLGPEAETLLFYAARERHIAETIAPAIEAGRWVISDRFSDSTRAYQGGGERVAGALLDRLERLVVAAAKPDLTIVLDLPPEIGLARARARRDGADRFEGEDLEFHHRLRNAFVEIARREPERCVLVDASGPRESTADRIWAAVSSRLAPR